MLFLVISEPRPEPPSGIVASRQRYWTWVQPLIDPTAARRFLDTSGPTG